MTRKITCDDLEHAIESKRLAGVEVNEFVLHPDDYFYLEAEWLRQQGDEHPYVLCKDMGVKLFVKNDAPRFGS